jgi:hypothetical protein
VQDDALFERRFHFVANALHRSGIHACRTSFARQLARWLTFCTCGKNRPASKKQHEPVFHWGSMELRATHVNARLEFFPGPCGLCAC